MERLICLKCGAPLEQHNDNVYKCKHCGLTWRDDIVQKEVEALRALLGEEKMEKIANLKQQLWAENNKPYLDSKEIVRLCKAIKAYNPDDFYAKFYEATNNGYDEDFCAVLNAIDVVEHYYEVERLIEYCLRSITAKNMLAICNLIERAFKDRDLETYGRIRTKYDIEAQKVDECVYDVRSDRDVFVCYSSKDMAKVEELVQYLEDNDLSCFVAVRNLQHGRGAKEKYWNEIKAAIENCKCLVFLSSVNSRTLKCDALEELRYLIDYNKKYPSSQIKKIEYLITDYKGAPIERTFKKIFDGLEYCCDKEAVLQRYYDFVFGLEDDAETVAEPIKTPEPVKPAPAVVAPSVTKPAEPAKPAVVKPVETAKPATDVSAFEYEKNGNAVTIKKYVGKDKDVVIPEKIDGLPVKKISMFVFHKHDEMESVIIPNTVTSIGMDAFSGCAGLKSVEIPNSVTEIGRSAFSSCTALTSVVIPSSVSSIEGNVFEYCSNLTYNEKNDLRYLGNANQPYLYLVGASNQDIKTALVDNQCRIIADKAFYECVSLTKVVIPSSVTFIGSLAFSKCSALKAVTIPNSVTSIGFGAFWGCSYLTDILIPESVTSLSKAIFTQCGALTDIKVSTVNKNYQSIEGNVYTKDGTTLISYAGAKKAPEFIVPIGVRVIEDYAFYYCANLKSVVMQNGVTHIGSSAFASCDSLTSVKIPEGVTKIAFSAFFKCSNLTSVIIPSSVTSVDLYPFSDCTNLTIYCRAKSQPKGWNSGWNDSNRPVVWGYTDEAVEPPKYVAIAKPATDVSAFEYEKNGNAVTIKKYIGKDTDVVIPEKIDGLPVKTIGRFAFNECSSLTSVVMPDSVTSIEEAGFQNCVALTKVEFSKNLKSIGNYAFGWCSSLTNVVIPNSVTDIGRSVFSWCTNLKSITISNRVTSITRCMFTKCESLTSVVIPNGVTSIEEAAFQECVALTKVEFSKSLKRIGNYAFGWCGSLTKLEIPSGVTDIGKSAFTWCTGLKSITLPKGLTCITRCMFTKCESLTSLEIPNGVTSIEEAAFQECTALAIVIMPDSVKSIGRVAFYGCISLKSIWISNNVTSIYGGAFQDCSNLTIYCEAKKAPSDWVNNWNSSSLPIVWGYKG